MIAESSSFFDMFIGASILALIVFRLLNLMPPRDEDMKNLVFDEIISACMSVAYLSFSFLAEGETIRHTQAASLGFSLFLILDLLRARQVYGPGVHEKWYREHPKVKLIAGTAIASASFCSFAGIAYIMILARM